MVPRLRLAAALIALSVCLMAEPATGQTDVRERAAPAGTVIPLPARCLLCADALLVQAPLRRGGDERSAEALPRGVAPVIGVFAGAAVGLAAVRIACAGRFCEMRDLAGLMVGAVVGYVVGSTIDGTVPRTRRW